MANPSIFYDIELSEPIYTTYETHHDKLPIFRNIANNIESDLAKNDLYKTFGVSDETLVLKTPGQYEIDLTTSIYSDSDMICGLFYIVNQNNDVLSGKKYLKLDPEEYTQINIKTIANVNENEQIYFGYQLDFPPEMKFRIDNDPINHNSSAHILIVKCLMC
jgi:hypothetical protein